MSLHPPKQEGLKGEAFYSFEQSLITQPFYIEEVLMTRRFLAALFLSVEASVPVLAQTTILGEWSLSGRACTSSAPTQDGFKIGSDEIHVLFNADQSYELRRTAAGCKTIVTGTYGIDAMKITFTAVTSQTCKQTSPQPMPETYSMFVACLNDEHMVLVATGSKAIVACPEDDALILNYAKTQSIYPGKGFYEQP